MLLMLKSHAVNIEQSLLLLNVDQQAVNIIGSQFC